MELDQLVPTAGGQYNHYQWLHTLHIDCYSAYQCATTDIGAIYSRDAQGRFTRPGEMNLGGLGYKTADVFLSPAENDPSRKRWNLKLIVQRRPAPVGR
jgi:hypothetical protein